MATRKRKTNSYSPAPIGDSGVRMYGGIVAEEFLRELQGERGIRTYREMADNDPTCGAVLFAIKMLIRQCQWTVQPADESVEAESAKTFLEECMEDMDVPWSTVVDQACSMFDYGWSGLELIYKRRGGPDTNDLTTRSKFDDGKIGWRNIQLRAQRSFMKWETDPEGNVVGMWQQPTTGSAVLLPAEKMLLFRTMDNGNPEGRSILRNAYRPWYFKKRIEEFEGIGVERDLAGLPVAYIPGFYFNPNASPADKLILASWQKLVTQVRRDQQEGILLPSDTDDKGNKLFDFQLMSTGGSRQFDTTKVIDRYDRVIATSVLADFIFLGQKSVGSFALSSDKTALFAVAIGAFTQIIADVFNRKAVTRLWQLNALPIEMMPELVPADLEHPNIAELGGYISALAGAGMPLFPDRDLENALRDAAGWPPAPEEGPDIDADAPGGQGPVPIVGPIAAHAMPVKPTNGSGNDGPGRDRKYGNEK